MSSLVTITENERTCCTRRELAVPLLAVVFSEAARGVFAAAVGLLDMCRGCRALVVGAAAFAPGATFLGACNCFRAFVATGFFGAYSGCRVLVAGAAFGAALGGEMGYTTCSGASWAGCAVANHASMSAFSSAVNVRGPAGPNSQPEGTSNSNIIKVWRN